MQKRDYIEIHRPQNALGHLLQWELHSKHHIQNAISWRP